MTLLSAVLLLLAALPADLGPEDLVKRLGSGDRIEQEEAARSLEELGSDALPALATPPPSRTRHPMSVPARRRCSNVSKGDSSPSPRGSRSISMVSRSATSSRARQRTGFTLTLDAGADVELPKRAIRAESSGKVTFWEAVDRARASGGHPPRPGVSPGPQHGATVVRLIPGAPPAFSVDEGGLRLQLLRLDRRRDREFVRTDIPNPAASDALYVELQAFAEPGALPRSQRTAPCRGDRRSGTAASTSPERGEVAERAIADGKVGQAGCPQPPSVACSAGTSGPAGFPTPPSLGNAPRDRLFPPARPAGHSPGRGVGPDLSPRRRDPPVERFLRSGFATSPSTCSWRRMPGHPPRATACPRSSPGPSSPSRTPRASRSPGIRCFPPAL